MIVASIDIGSNSTRLLIVENEPNGKFKYLVYEGVITRLGKNLHKTSKLDKNSWQDTLSVLKKYHNIIEKYQPDKIGIFGTAPLREASDSLEFVKQVKDILNWEIEILTGQKEAQLVYIAVMNSMYNLSDEILIIDIGGYSTEFIRNTNKIWSLPLGSVRLTEKFLFSDPPLPQEKAKLIKYTQNILEESLCELSNWQGKVKLIGVAGTITTLAAIQQKMEIYQSEKIHNFEFNLHNLEKIIEQLCSLSLDKRKKIIGLNPKRADIIIGGAILLESILKILNTYSIIISDKGVLFGKCYQLIQEYNILNTN